MRGAISCESRKAIAIVCYDRFDYFIQTLEAILNYANSDCDIYIFQDGEGVGVSGEGYIKIIEAISEIKREDRYKNIFYSRSQVNNGIHRQWFRAIELPLLSGVYDVVYMFEDDIVITNKFFNKMNELAELFITDMRVALFSAYNGSCRKEGVGESGYVRMAHDWAFGITKRAWMQVRSLYLAYCSLIDPRDYRRRDSNIIRKWFERVGFRWVEGREGCDSALEYIIAGAGMARVATKGNLAVPIGRVGSHFSEKLFEDSFRDLKTSDDIMINELSSDEFASILESNLVADPDRVRYYLTHPDDAFRLARDLTKCSDTRLSTGERSIVFEKGSHFFVVNEADSGSWKLWGVGSLLFGPYIRVEPGSYFLFLKTNSNAEYHFDVVCDSGGVILCESRVEVGLNGVYVCAFDIGYKVNDLEIRIKNLGGEIMQVLEIRLTRLVGD